jgi:hypothetical protein
VVQPGGGTGTLDTLDCDVNAAGQPTNAGCGGYCAQSDSYGAGFNAAGGGVYAMDWRSDSIRIWHFTRANIPQDIKSGTPNPDGWSMVSSRLFARPNNIARF